MLDVGAARVTVTANPGGGNTTAQIGSNPCCGVFFDGKIDNVFIYDEILSDSRIDQIRVGGGVAILGVPEPSTLLLLGLGLAGLTLIRRRKKSA